MKKNYVLDTNVLIHNPSCILKFEDNDIFIPSLVIEELDKFKTERSERGYSARNAIRHILSFREQGNLLQGVVLPGGGMLRLLNKDIDIHRLPEGWEKDKKDNLILLNTLDLLKTSRAEGVETILVTNDANMMLKADIMFIPVQEYRNDRVDMEQKLYSGRSVRRVNDSEIDTFFGEGSIPVPETDTFAGITENEYVNLISDTGKSALSKYQNNRLVKLYNSVECPSPFGLKPRNMAQRFLMEALLSSYDEHPLTIVNGPAGTGKTLFALGCGLEQVMEQGKYKKVLVCRANVTMDEDLGYLPGTEREKIDPLFRGVYDNLAVLFGGRNKTDDENGNDKKYGKGSGDTIRSIMDQLFDRNYLELQSVAYLRGRSICDTYVIIDEAQNCTPNQILSIITRISEGSKIVILGDVNQIDSPRLDRSNNGLAFALDRMKGSKLCEICSFDESESTRSPLAKEAAERLVHNKK